MPDDPFSSRLTLLVSGRLKGQIKIGGVKNRGEENKASKCSDLEASAFLKE